MHRFDYRFLADAIPAELSGASNVLFDLRGRNDMRMQQDERLFEQLRQAAIVESVRGSNAIEGIVTTQARLQELMDGSVAPETHGEREILGYKAALQEMYAPGFTADLTQDYIRHLHALLMQGVSDQAGNYKQANNWIQERDAMGRLSVRFVPVSASDTPCAMDQMVMAFHEAAQVASINVLALTACVAVDFLCIHPFADGNGRVSRLLTTMLLQRFGFDIGRYVSIEGMIERHKAGYYDALEEASVGWHENENDYTPFILYLLQILYACYKEFDQRYLDNSLSKVPKTKLVETLLMSTYAPVSKREICERLPDVSVTTVERVLADLMREGRVVKIGSYRDARYRRA